MKITMIGMSGSGKTSFMSGLYESLAVNNLTGFRIIPKAPESNESAHQFIQTNRLENLSFSELGYKFPSGTQQTTLWSFDLLHKATIICGFEWIDYRGGILSETIDDIASDETKRKEVDELQVHILASNAVMLFVDSIKLTYYDNILQARRESGVDKIVNLVTNYDQNYPDRNLTFVIVLTKVDAIEDKWKANNYELLVNRGIEAFQELRVICQQRPNWVGGILPVSAVGEGKVDMTITPPANIRTPLITAAEMIGFPEPINTGHALFYCVGQTLKRMRDRTQSKIHNYQDDIVAILSRSSLAHEIWARITRKQSPREIALELYAQQQREEAGLATYEQYVDPLCVIALDKVRTVCR